MVVGYGNEGSGYMRDFENWRRGGDHYAEAYGGRNAEDYRDGYGEGRHYDPSDYDMRRDYEFEPRYNYQSENRDHYDDYQSYPTYVARAYGSDERDQRESNRFRNHPQNQGREYGNRHRPSIREKRY